MNFVLIDASYFIFYRYHALRVWWAKARKENDEKLIDSIEFVDKFKKTFISKIEEMNKKLNIKQSIKIIGKDCPQNQIWRNKLISNYKYNREITDVGEFFKLTFDNNLFKLGGIALELEYPSLEADDCIALTSKYLHEKFPSANIFIITSDHDYLQLNKERIHLLDLKYNYLNQSKTSFNDPKKDLFVKIVSGDKSDNIPSIIPNCGIKTAVKYYENPLLFKKLLSENKSAKDQFEINRQIIDFEYIPLDIKIKFIKLLEIIKGEA